MRKFLLFLLVAGVYVAHQDYWNWPLPNPMVLGFLPIGLAYHAAYSVATAVMMAILVKWAWPAKIDADEPPARERPESRP